MEVESECGILYIASGDEYRAEAVKSAESARNAMPDVSRALISDESPETEVFDIEIELSEPEHGFIDKVANLPESPFEKTLFLDTDTYVNEDCRDLFDVLNKFDIAAAHASIRRHEVSLRTRAAPIVDIPDAYSQFNTGVLAFRETPEVQDFLKDWRDRFREHRSRYEQMNDQPAFRAACFNGDVRIATLPPEYNTRVPFRGFIRDTPKIVHGNRDDLAEIADRLGAVKRGALYDSATTGENTSVLVDPGKWPRRIEAVRLSLGEVGYLGTIAWLLRWIRADNRDGLRPKRIRELLKL